MKKIYRSAIALLIVVLMIFSMSACGNNTQNNNANDNNENQQSENNQQNNNEDTSKDNNEANNNTEDNTDNNTQDNNTDDEIDPLMKYDPAIKMFVGQYVADETKFHEGESPENNAAYDVFKDVAGIEFIPQFTASVGDAYYEKLKLQIASDDIPDMAKASINEIETLIKGDMIEDLSPYIEKYASDTLKSVLYARDKAVLTAVTKDDAVYAIPSVVDQNNGVPLLYIREDVFERSEEEMPETFDEAMDLAEKMIEIDDTIEYGLGFFKELQLPFTATMNAYGAYPGYFIEEGDELVYGSLQPEMKHALTKTRELVERGIIDQDFATTDAARVDALVGAGKVAMYIMEFWHPLTGMSNTIRNVEGSDWMVMKVPAQESGQITPAVPLNVDGYHFIRKGYEHPEALIIALNHFVEGFYNEEAEFTKEWKAASDAYAGVMLHSFLPLFMDNPSKNYNFSLNIKEALENDDPSDLSIAEKDLYDKIVEGGPDNWAWQKIYLESVPAASTYDNYLYNAFVGAPTKAMTNYGSILQTLESRTFTEFLVGNRPIDEFDDFVDTYLNQGGKEVIESVNN